MQDRIGIMGASSLVGGALIRLIQQERIPVRAVMHDYPSAVDLRAANDDDEVAVLPNFTPDEVRLALGGLAVAVVIVGPNDVTMDNLRQLTALAPQVNPGIHLILLSTIGADHDSVVPSRRMFAQAEGLVRQAGTAFTIVRCAPLVLDFEGYVWADGVLRGPAAHGRVAPVSRCDVARATREISLRPREFAGQTVTLTGPAALTLDEIAAAIGRVRGHNIRFESQTLSEAHTSRQHQSTADTNEAIGLYQAIEAGDFDVVTSDFVRIVGARPTSFEDALEMAPTFNQVFHENDAPVGQELRCSSDKDLDSSSW